MQTSFSTDDFYVTYVTQLGRPLKIWNHFNICAYYGQKLTIVGDTESFEAGETIKTFSNYPLLPTTFQPVY